MEQEKKEKLKNLLSSIGNDKDRKEIAEMNKLDRVGARVDEVVEKLEESTKSLASTMDKHRSLLVKSSESTVNAFADSTEIIAKKLDQVATTIVNNKPKDLSGFFKDWPTLIAQIAGSSQKTSELITNLKWNSSVGVRNSSGSPIDPALTYANGLATPADVSGTIVAFDDGGTIRTVSAANPFPVDATVQATVQSSGMAGLIVNLTKVTTSALSGIRVYQQNSPSVTVQSSTMSGLVVNTELPAAAALSDTVANPTTPTVGSANLIWDSSAGSWARINSFGAYRDQVTVTGLPAVGVVVDDGGTLRSLYGDSTNGLWVNVKAGSISITSSAMSGLAVNLTKVNTSILSGLRVYQQNSPSVTVQSSTMSGLVVNITKLGSTAISMNSGTRDAGTQRVTIATNDSVPVTGTFFQATQPVSIVTSTLAGVRAFIQNFPATQAVSATNLDIRDLTFASDTIDASGSTLGANSGVDIGDVTINNASGGSAVNIQDGGNTITVDGTVSATITSTAIAGLAVRLQNTSTAIVTTTVVGVVASAAGNTKLVSAQGAGKQIYVYAWNLSFAGTTNVKFTDGVSSKILAGLIYGIANAGGGNAVSPNFLMTKPQPDLFHTSPNSSLYINLSAGVAVGGSVSYFVI